MEMQIGTKLTFRIVHKRENASGGDKGKEQTTSGTPGMGHPPWKDKSPLTFGLKIGGT